MSRTYAHVPDTVEVARATPDQLTLRHAQHWDTGCDTSATGNCQLTIARWASAHRWSRRGTLVLERRAAVNANLNAMRDRYRAGHDMDDALPDPVRICLCQNCGT